MIRQKAIKTLISLCTLLGKTLLCAVSVVKAGHVQDRAATSCVQREISVLVWVQPFLANRFVTLLVSYKVMILPRLVVF